MIELWVAAAALLAALAALVKFARNLRKPPFEGIPMVPNPHWFLGHLRLMGGDFRVAHRRIGVDYANESGICSFWAFYFPAVSVSRVKDIRAVLHSSTVRKPMIYSRPHLNRFLGPRNIGALMGREWKYHRSAIIRAFSPTALADAHASMVSVSSTLVASLLKKMDEGKCASVSMDVNSLLKMATMDIFGAAALGEDFGCCAELCSSPIAVAFDHMSEELTRRIFAPLNPLLVFYSLPTARNRRHQKERQLIRKVLNDIISSRRKVFQTSQNGTKSFLKSAEKDLLSHLLRAHDEKKDKGFEDDLADETFSDIMMSLLFAGYDTTSITLTYVLYLISQHPDVEAMCLQEVNSVLGQGSPRLNDEEVKFDPDELVYCTAVIMEALRLYPPAPTLSRNLEKPLELGGCLIPAGTLVRMSVWLTHRDAENFPRPLEFVPERWASQTRSGDWVERFSKGQQNGHNRDQSSIPPANRDAFLAFSGGARSCAGQKFALQEAVTILALLIRDLKFESTPGYVLEPCRSGIVQKPRGGMPMTITRRDSVH